MDGERRYADPPSRPPQVLASYSARRLELQQRELTLLATRDLEAVTRDGVAIQLMANIDLPEEVDEAAAFGADGHRPLPQRVPLHREEPRPADRGGSPGALPPAGRGRGAASGDHPHLRPRRPQAGARGDGDPRGEPGARAARHPPDLARPQSLPHPAARLCSAPALYGDLWMMLPLVSRWRRCGASAPSPPRWLRSWSARGCRTARDIKLGVMIEVPSAALIADMLAREVDFFSHRHQRPDPVLARRRPQQRARGRPLPAASSRRCCA